MNKKVAYKVEMIEYKAGWGSRVDEMLYFSNEEDAKSFVVKYNKKCNNNSSTIPDWYIFARFAGECIVPDYVNLFNSVESTGFNLN